MNWFDHAIVGETSSTYTAETLTFLENKNHKPEQGPAFKKMEGLKRRKYAVIMAVAESLSQKHKLDFKPIFLFPIISSLGFMNTDMLKLQKIFVEQYVQHLLGLVSESGTIQESDEKQFVFCFGEGQRAVNVQPGHAVCVQTPMTVDCLGGVETTNLCV